MILILAVLIFSGLGCGKKEAQNTPSPTPRESKSATALEEDAIRLFFSKIDEGRTDEVLLMMTDELIGGDKQVWTANFESIDSISVKSIEPEEPAAWHNDEHYYRLTLEVKIKDNVQAYGWENGGQERYLTLKKIEGSWKIHQLSTQLE